MLAAVGILCVATSLCVASGFAARATRPRVPDTAAAAAAASTEVADVPADDAGTAVETARVAALAEPAEPMTSGPNADALRLDRAFWTEAERHPDGDAHAVVARREHIEVQALMTAISEVSEYRVRLDAQAREVLAGRDALAVLPDGVHGSSRGNTTLAIRLYVPGCPARHGADRDQLARAQAMLTRLVSMIPEGIDSFEAGTRTGIRVAVASSASTRHGALRRIGCRSPIAEQRAPPVSRQDSDRFKDTHPLTNRVALGVSGRERRWQHVAGDELALDGDRGRAYRAVAPNPARIAEPLCNAPIHVECTSGSWASS